MTTFNITNISPDLQKMTMTVFYEFSNGDVLGQKFPANTGVDKILEFGNKQIYLYSEREAEMNELREKLLSGTMPDPNEQIWQS